MRRRHHPPARRHTDRGSATVEVAIAMPVVMSLLMLVVQAGLYFHTRAVATTAAHKALDAARVEEGTAPAGREAATAFLDRNAAGLHDRHVTVERAGDLAEVTITGDVVSVMFGIHAFPVRVTADAPIEQVDP